MIKLTNVRKSYDNGRVEAVKGLDLEVRSGEIFGFLGPNGAGKTTTIKMMVGLLKPDAGTILLDGIDVVASPLEAKERIGFVSDDPALYEKMTGGHFLGFIADVFRVPTESRRKIEQLAEEFEIREALGDVVSSYSHGMRQKLSVIAALLHEPEIFILDEPMAGLDPRAAFMLKEKMRAYTEAGKTVFFSTHVMEVAEKICDRVGIIRKGEMISVGPLTELRARAGEANATLEKVFLELTDERVSVG